MTQAPSIRPWMLVGVAIVAAVVLTLIRTKPQNKSASSRTTIVLYDAKRDTKPASQTLLLTAVDRQRPLTTGAVERFSNEEVATELDSMHALTDMAGYTAPTAIMPTLNRRPGFRVELAMRVLREEHVRRDRAGVSVTVLASDLRGIELGFWEDAVFAQEGGEAATLFTHAEDAAFDTGATMVRYAIDIVGDDYRVFANDELVLAGPVRDYRAWTPPMPQFPDAYEQPSSIVVSDNTTSARGRFAIRSLAVSLF